jgi:serine/threonine-protein kinase HipA
MSLPPIKYCPGTLSAGFATYSTTCLRRVFNGRKVHHILPYDSPATDDLTDEMFAENRGRMSISGVQEKFSVIQDKNKLRLIDEGERGTHILKPIPHVGKQSGQMPANEHLTMQIARQVYRIETAENALIFFKNGAPAYITKRFDVAEDGSKLAKEDFASLTGRTPQTHGESYKYQGNYLELFEHMKRLLPAYRLEAPKLFQLLVFNYLFSNGDAHLKNFALLETPQGDFRLSPAYDLMNTRMFIEDPVFALEDGLLPRKMNQGSVWDQFMLLADKAGLSIKQKEKIMIQMLLDSEKVEYLIEASFLAEGNKRSYLQAYQTRLKKLQKQSTLQ